MNHRIRTHQWPNVLAIDAAAIAVAWQWALADSLGVSPGWPATAVLGLSVWLTYTADRLFDVSSRQEVDLLSHRHRFAKRQRSTLWRVWWCLLALNLCLATQLSTLQLQRGFALLAICLLYTALNQKLSRRFFPKEVCVALIYAAGVCILIEAPIPWLFFVCFSGLCWLNCMMIGTVESSLDAKMQVHSLAPLIGERILILSSLILIGSVLALKVMLRQPLLISLLFLLLAFIGRSRMSKENFRTVVDTLMLIGPTVWILFGS